MIRSKHARSDVGLQFKNTDTGAFKGCRTSFEHPTHLGELGRFVISRVEVRTEEMSLLFVMFQVQSEIHDFLEAHVDLQLKCQIRNRVSGVDPLREIPTQHDTTEQARSRFDMVTRRRRVLTAYAHLVTPEDWTLVGPVVS